jgi:hypothetical protein
VNLNKTKYSLFFMLYNDNTPKAIINRPRITRTVDGPRTKVEKTNTKPIAMILEDNVIIIALFLSMLDKPVQYL